MMANIAVKRTADIGTSSCRTETHAVCGAHVSISLVFNPAAGRGHRRYRAQGHRTRPATSEDETLVHQIVMVEDSSVLCVRTGTSERVALDERATGHCEDELAHTFDGSIQKQEEISSCVRFAKLRHHQDERLRKCASNFEAFIIFDRTTSTVQCTLLEHSSMEAKWLRMAAA